MLDFFFFFFNAVINAAGKTVLVNHIFAQEIFLKLIRKLQSV